MRVIIGGQSYPTIDGSSVSITRAMSDPVPTCTVNLVDNTSSLAPQAFQEILVLDDQVTPNPTVNLLQNPSLNPYNTDWFVSGGVTGIAVSQTVGGGVTYTMSNAANNSFQEIYQYPQVGSVVAGQTYMMSYYTQASAPVGFTLAGRVDFLDSAQNTLAQFQLPHIAAPTTLTRISLTMLAPAGTSFAYVAITPLTTSGTNSGSVSFMQLQFEPQWFPNLAYPTPWCGPAQTNCQQLPLGLWIRQYRKFAGFVNHVVNQDYKGNVRTVVVNAVGYAWLMSVILGNDNFTSKTDAQVIIALLAKYLIAPPNFFIAAVSMVTTTNIITGASISNLQLNWDDLRSTFDSIASLSGFYWTIDYYWNFVYAPPGYFSMQIGLICDNSSTPDMLSTFPAYNFSAETDATQPGSNILTIGGTSGGTTFTSQVIDPSMIAQIGQISGYTLPFTTSWMRKVTDSALLANNDTVTRGQAELIQYDAPRGIYHLSTNVEIIAGYGIAVTSATDGLMQSTQLIQQVTATWLGTSETLTDFWEYVADLGAANRAATNMISRIFRNTTKNTSAPAINLIALTLLEKIGWVDTSATASVIASYINTVQSDTPIGYYRLSNLSGTVADDWSGNGNSGTINAAPTLGVATLLTDSAAPDTSDLAITFAAASSQDIHLPLSMVPTGAHAWSLECWFKITAVPASGRHDTLMGWGANTGNQKFGVLNIATTGTTWKLNFSTNSGDIQSGNLSINTIYHVVGTYDGTSTRLYVNGSLVAGPTAFALNLTQTICTIASYSGGPYTNNFFSGTLDEVAFYTYALSSTQVSAHHTAGI